MKYIKYIYEKYCYGLAVDTYGEYEDYAELEWMREYDMAQADGTVWD